VAKADHMGRPPIHDDNFPAGAWLLERARELAVESARPEPLIMGRHLIEFGITPGPHFGPVLEACYEAQMEGKFSTLEEGIDYARRIFL
jgi:tRNA nucleotidyltransferase (CCA-adding enzyme)